MSKYKSPLHETVATTNTDVWNDACSVEALTYAIENGAVGATTNPVIVGNVLDKEMHLWEDRIKEMVRTMTDATEEDIAWKLNEEMAIKGAELLYPVFEKENKLKGRISIQTNARYFRNTRLMADQAEHFGGLAENMQVKMPVTKEGVDAIEEATARGVNINATVCFTVPQSLAVAEAVERGLKRRESEGKDTSLMRPVCTIMVGRMDDWLKVLTDKENIITDPGYLEWAGVAVFKRAYEIYQEKGYRARLLSAAYRNYFHWSEFIGGDVVLTIPYKWQKRFNSSDVEVRPRMEDPVDRKIVDELLKKFPDFRRGYEPDGMKPEEFEQYGATRRTLRSFIQGYERLCGIIRDFMISDPDK
jgi:transaldolase